MPQDDQPLLIAEITRLGLGPPPAATYQPPADLINRLTHWQPAFKSSHVCGPDCKDGGHVIEFALPAGVTALMDPHPPSEDVCRIRLLITKLAWEAASPEETAELMRLLSKNQPPA